MNPLHIPIHRLFEKLNFLYFQINYFQKRIERLKKDIRKNVAKHESFQIEDLFHGTSLVITDLTGPTDNGWLLKFRTGRHFVKGEEFIEQLDWFLEREASLTVQQGYEVFESYLYDITASYLHANQKKLQIDIFKDYLPNCDTYEQKVWGSAVRGLFRRKANSVLIDYLREFGGNLKKAELQEHNNRLMNLKDWFEVTTQLRHGTTHSLGKIKKDCIKKLSKDQVKLLQTIYPGQFVNGEYEITLSFESAKSAITTYAEYGFAIFKSLSVEQGYEWKNLLEKSASAG
ncbi:MAG: hypothetical protein WDZ80_03450 [Candidatus Paceibacterota bacterium]